VPLRNLFRASWRGSSAQRGRAEPGRTVAIHGRRGRLKLTVLVDGWRPCAGGTSAGIAPRGRPRTDRLKVNAWARPLDEGTIYIAKSRWKWARAATAIRSYDEGDGRTGPRSSSSAAPDNKVYGTGIRRLIVYSGLGDGHPR